MIKTAGGGIVAALSPRMAQAADPDFSIICLPDTQFMADSGSCPNAAGANKAFSAVMNHIVSVAASINLKGVWSLGDCANLVLTASKNSQDTIVEIAYNILSGAGIAYQTCIGNHDYSGSVASRTAGYLWANASGIFYPAQQVSRFGAGITLGAGDLAQWGGARASTSGEATYSLWSIGTWRLLLLALSFYPTSAEMAWANTVMAAYPDHTTILLTHGWVTADGFLFPRIGYGPDGYSMAASPASNSATQMWGTLASDGGFTQLQRAQNFGMGIGGHDLAAGNSSSYYYRRLPLTSTSVRAHATQHIFCNLQAVDDALDCGGDPPDGILNTGHLMYLMFSPSAGTCTVYVQSVNSGNYVQPRLTTGWTATPTAVDTFSFAPLTPLRKIFPMPGTIGH